MSTATDALAEYLMGSFLKNQADHEKQIGDLQTRVAALELRHQRRKEIKRHNEAHTDPSKKFYITCMIVHENNTREYLCDCRSFTFSPSYPYPKTCKHTEDLRREYSTRTFDQIGGWTGLGDKVDSYGIM